jgi:uncharacterized membrane protein
VSRDYQWERPPTPESVSRLMNFTDGIVAIAVTLLVLPLTDIAPPAAGESVWVVMSRNDRAIFSFLLSFAITLAFWRRHHRLFDGLRSFDQTLVALDGLWLMGVVFLQFPTNMLGHSGPQGGVISLYALTLAAIALLNIGIWVYLRTRPALLPPERLVSRDSIGWGAATAVWLIVVTIVGLTAPNAALWLMLGLLVLGLLEWLDRSRRARSTTTARSAP